VRVQRHTAIQWYGEQRRRDGGLGGAARRWWRNRRRAAVVGDGKRADGDAAASDIALARGVPL
jgi:hypothetical protein